VEGEDLVVRRLDISVCGAVLVLWALPAFSAPAAPMPLDQPVSLPKAITAVCAGIGESQEDPRWAAYQVRVEFANAANQYIAGVDLALSQGRKVLAHLSCSGAWLLFQLPSGRYEVSATRQDVPASAPASAAFTPPAKGQKRVVLIFKSKS
jgi:hypothetical protein